MTAGAVRTQGTHLFFVNPFAAEPEIIKMACPSGITGITAGAKTRIPLNCLDEVEDQQYVSGLGEPGAGSVPFTFKPKHPSHQVLVSSLKESAQNIEWMVCLSDGVGVPTLGTDGKLEAPDDRTCAGFIAYVADADIDISTNELVRGTLSLQRSGKVNWHWVE